MKTEQIYRIVILALLTGILAVQIAILHRMTKPLDVNVRNSVETYKKPFSF